MGKYPRALDSLYRLSKKESVKFLNLPKNKCKRCLLQKNKKFDIVYHFSYLGNKALVIFVSLC